MKTPKIFTREQYRKWQIEKRLKKKSNLVTAGIIAAAGLTLFFILEMRK